MLQIHGLSAIKRYLIGVDRELPNSMEQLIVHFKEKFDRENEVVYFSAYGKDKVNEGAGPSGYGGGYIAPDPNRGSAISDKRHAAGTEVLLLQQAVAGDQTQLRMQSQETPASGSLALIDPTQLQTQTILAAGDQNLIESNDPIMRPTPIPATRLQFQETPAADSADPIGRGPIIIQTPMVAAENASDQNLSKGNDPILADPPQHESGMQLEETQPAGSAEPGSDFPNTELQIITQTTLAAADQEPIMGETQNQQAAADSSPDDESRDDFAEQQASVTDQKKGKGKRGSSKDDQEKADAALAQKLSQDINAGVSRRSNRRDAQK